MAEDFDPFRPLSRDERAAAQYLANDSATDAARVAAIARWAAKATLFARAKEDGRANVPLIALAGLMPECLHVCRARIPNRRRSDKFGVMHGSRKWTLACLALQAGCQLETPRHVLDRRDLGPLGAALALVDEAAP